MLKARRAAGARSAAALLALLLLPAAAGSAPVEPVPPAVPVEPAAPATARVGPDAAVDRPAGRTALDRDAPRPVAAATLAPRPAAVAAPTAAIVPGSVNRSSIDLTAEYDVAVRLSFATRAFAADTVMTVRNDSGGPIDRLELNTIATMVGRIRLGATTVDGSPVSPTIEDQTIVVPLGGILEAGRSVQVRISYSASLNAGLAGSTWMFTRANGIVSVHRWIPWVSKKVSFNRPNHGDPFVTPVSPRVRVSFSSDRPLVYATPGERLGGSRLSQRFQATNVRDFAFTAAPDYRTISGRVGDTTVRVYYRAGFPASTALAAARSALAKMEGLVGQYPYPTYRVAQSAGGFGMESPGLTWIPTGIAAGNVRYLVHHETGHQWFYSLVGNDQAAQPWADEAATDFLARYTLASKRASRCATARLDLSIYRYSNACYYEVIYIQGGNFLDDLRRRMGSTPFWRGMRAYVAANRFGFGSTQELLTTLDAHTPLNLVPRFRPRFPSMY